MHSGDFLQGFGLREPTLCHGKGRVLPSVLIVGREAAHDLVAGVEYFQLHVANRGLQKVVDRCAIRRIFGRRFLGRKRRPDNASLSTRMAAAGWESHALPSALLASGSWRSGVRLSRIQKERPCVAI